MPRQERTKSGTGIYHVMLRGINRQDIFEDAEDYLQMVACLRMITEPSPGSRVWTYDGLGRQLTQGIETGGNLTYYEMKNYYDNYNFTSNYSSLFPSGVSNLLPTNYYNGRGQQTGVWQRTNDGGSMLSVLGYDEMGFLSKKTEAGSDGKLSESDYTNNLIGDVTQESFRKYKPNTTTNTLECLARGSIENNYDYQHTNLLHSSVITIYDKNNNMRTDTIQNLTYDDFGHVMTNDRSGTAADMTYEYDQMHGWLRSIRSSKWFEQNLYRETEGQYPRYNGNISAMSWKTGNGWLRRFDYQYNDMNWLTHADFSYYRITNASPGLPPTLTLIPYVGSDNEDYTSMYYYDKNGNLTGAYRQGYVTNSEDDNNYDTLDDYNVEYYGNQKRSVNGQGCGEPSFYGSSAFIDGMPDGDNEYAYNGNGDMTKDLNKGITKISYDLLGNMQEITMSGNRKIRYEYAADGTRLKTVHRQWKNNAWLRDSTEYFGNLIIKNGIPSMYRFGGGYYAFNNGLLSDCHFYIQDYLGSNRMVVNKNGTVKQTTHYYPYGGIIGGKSTYPEYQSYKHTDKELDRTYGLEWYDVHARQYDPVVPSWHAIDPLAEKYYYISPYAYCGGDSVNCVDPTGMDYWSTSDPHEIEMFLLNCKDNGFGSVNTSNWHHSTDADFLANLAYNDMTNKYYYSYCSIENGEVVCNGMSFEGLGINAFSNANNAFNSLGKSLKENAGNSTLGNNGKFYWHASGENGFYGNQYVKTAKLANFGSGILRVTGPVGLLLSGNELYNGYQLDGGDVQTVGYNTVRAMASVAGGWAVGTAGLKIGAAIGFGLGNVPGSVIGGAVGGFLGTFGGSWFGTNYIDYLYGK